MGNRFKGRRILLVEDEYLIADAMQRELEAKGAIVLGPVASVRKALPPIDAETPDRALVDMDPGGETAFPVAEALQERGIPFLFTTGHDAADVPQARRHVPRLEKPVPMTAIRRTGDGPVPRMRETALSRRMTTDVRDPCHPAGGRHDGR